jgi:dienelactone hydrolase
MKHIVALALLFSPFAAAQAAVQTKSIAYKVGDAAFVGTLAWDDAVATEKSPAAAVLVCPEWWGCNEYAISRATQLAELGYVAFAIDMYGSGPDGKAKTTVDAMQAGEWAGGVFKDPAGLQARVTAGFEALTSQKIVDKTKVAAIGYCMGGTVALALARTGADVKAVVAFHASNVSAADETTNAKIKGTIMVCHGQEDAFVKPGELDTFHAQMKAAKVDYVLSTYSGAVHAFTNPKADSFGIPGVAYDKNADVRSWTAMKALFEEKFGRSEAQEVRNRKIAEVEAAPRIREREWIAAEAARGVGDAPAVLTPEAIGAMDRSTAMREMSSRRTYPQRNPSLDRATRSRLEKEVNLLQERVKALNAPK